MLLMYWRNTYWRNRGLLLCCGYWSILFMLHDVGALNTLCGVIVVIEGSWFFSRLFSRQQTLSVFLQFWCTLWPLRKYVFSGSFYHTGYIRLISIRPRHCREMRVVKVDFHKSTSNLVSTQWAGTSEWTKLEKLSAVMQNYPRYMTWLIALSCGDVNQHWNSVQLKETRLWLLSMQAF